MAVVDSRTCDESWIGCNVSFWRLSDADRASSSKEVSIVGKWGNGR